MFDIEAMLSGECQQYMVKNNVTNLTVYSVMEHKQMFCFYMLLAVGMLAKMNPPLITTWLKEIKGLSCLLFISWF